MANQCARFKERVVEHHLSSVVTSFVQAFNERNFDPDSPTWKDNMAPTYRAMTASHAPNPSTDDGCFSLSEYLAQIKQNTAERGQERLEIDNVQVDRLDDKMARAYLTVDIVAWRSEGTISKSLNVFDFVWHEDVSGAGGHGRWLCVRSKACPMSSMVF